MFIFCINKYINIFIIHIQSTVLYCNYSHLCEYCGLSCRVIRELSTQSIAREFDPRLGRIFLVCEDTKMLWFYVGQGVKALTKMYLVYETYKM